MNFMWIGFLVRKIKSPIIWTSSIFVIGFNSKFRKISLTTVLTSIIANFWPVSKLKFVFNLFHVFFCCNNVLSPIQFRWPTMKIAKFITNFGNYYLEKRTTTERNVGKGMLFNSFAFKKPRRIKLFWIGEISGVAMQDIYDDMNNCSSRKLNIV